MTNEIAAPADSKELIKQMINHLVYDRDDEAKAAFKQVVTNKSVDLTGGIVQHPEIVTPSDETVTDETDDETV
jgi:hypothetical protein